MSKHGCSSSSEVEPTAPPHLIWNQTRRSSSTSHKEQQLVLPCEVEPAAAPRLHLRWNQLLLLTLNLTINSAQIFGTTPATLCHPLSMHQSGITHGQMGYNNGWCRVSAQSYNSWMSKSDKSFNFVSFFFPSSVFIGVRIVLLLTGQI